MGAALVTAMPVGAGAHPHIWVTYAVVLPLGPQGLEALELVWTFDEEFSRMILSAFDADAPAADHLRALRAIPYVIEVSYNGLPVEVGDPERLTVSVVNRQVTYRFSIPLRPPVRAPGLVDIHVHLFHTTGLKEAWAGDYSVSPDGFSFRSGVTTMVDAGSSGWRNFETFRHTVIDRAQTRIFALINIAGLGMSTNAAEQVSSEFQPEQVARLDKVGDENEREENRRDSDNGEVQNALDKFPPGGRNPLIDKTAQPVFDRVRSLAKDHLWAEIAAIDPSVQHRDRGDQEHQEH